MVLRAMSKKKTLTKKNLIFNDYLRITSVPWQFILEISNRQTLCPGNIN